MSKNTCTTIFFAFLICTTLLIDSIECARKTASRRGGGGSSGSSNSNQQTHRTATTASSARVSQNSHADVAKLSYPNYNSQPNSHNTPNQQPAYNPSYNQPPPSYTNNAGNQGAPPAYAPPNQQPNFQPNYNPAPPAYPGLGAGHAAPQYPVNNGYPQQSFNQPAPGGYHPQPQYNNYPAPQQQSSGIGLGTAVQTAAIAGIGGLALYGALKPGEEKIIYINNGTNGSETPTSTTVAPVAGAVNGGPVPLASTPVPLAPMPPGVSAMPVVDHMGLVMDPVTNTTINCTALLMAMNDPTSTTQMAVMMNTTTDESSSSISPMPSTTSMDTPTTTASIPAVCMTMPSVSSMPTTQSMPVSPIVVTSSSTTMPVHIPEGANVPLAGAPSITGTSPQPIVSEVRMNTTSVEQLQSQKVNPDSTMSAAQNADGKGDAMSLRVTVISILIPMLSLFFVNV